MRRALIVVLAVVGGLVPPLIFAGGVAASPATPAAGSAVNTLVSGDDAAGHGMPSLAANPRDRRQLLGVAKAFRGDTVYPFTFASDDDGATWHDNGPLPLPLGFDRGSSDATAAFAADGTGVVAAAAWSADSGAIFVWRTADGGHSFAPPVAIDQVAITWPADALPTSAPDQPRLAAAADGTVYLAFARLDPDDHVFLTRSRDGGRSFEEPRPLDGKAAFPNVVAGSAGTVYLFFGREQPAGPRLAVATSTDGGEHIGPPVVIPWPPVVPQLSPPAGAPWIRYWPSVGIDPRDGTLYLTFCQTRPGGDHLDVVLTRSRDGGRTWDTPISLGNDSSGDAAERFQAQLAVAPTGDLFVSYYALAGGRVDVYLARSTDRGVHFDPSERVSDVSFDPALGAGNPGDLWIGDYQALAVGQDAVHPCWTDTRGRRLDVFSAALPLETVEAATPIAAAEGDVPASGTSPA